MAAKQGAAKAGLPVNVQEELRKQRETMKSRIGAVGGGDKIRVTQGKKFVMPDGTEGPGPLNVVILDFKSMNAWHDRPYKKGEESPPACFAIGDNPNELIPSPNSPRIQAKTCAECAFNEWGSRGAGKECGNTRLLAVREPGDDAGADIRILQVSPTAIKAFDAYVKSLEVQFDGVPIQFETEIYFDPNLDYPTLRFGNPKPNKNLDAHFGQQKAATARLAEEPDVSQYKPVVAKPLGKGAKR
jgi:hypothetical protein